MKFMNKINLLYLDSFKKGKKVDSLFIYGDKKRAIKI